MKLNSKQIVLLSPFLILITNGVVAIVAGEIIGKWAFAPMILIGWTLWLFFIIKYGGKASITKWLQKSKGKWGWKLGALLVGLIPLPIFLLHSDTLSVWSVWAPWILLALINPWIEEFYWRGLLLDYTQHWKTWTAVLFSSAFFALNHLAFGINSQVNSGVDVLLATFIMGLVWAWVYQKTKSLRWAIFSHFLVDFFNLSVPAFLDLFEKGGW